MTRQIIIVGTIFLGLAVSIVSFFYFDKRLYYFGEQNFDFYKLPFGIVPDARPDFEGGFALRDKYGVTIIANGNTYLNGAVEKIEIEKVNRYCVDDDQLIATVLAADGLTYQIECKSLNDDFEVVVSNASEPDSSSSVVCIDITGGASLRGLLFKMRLWSQLGIFAFFWGFIFGVIIIKRRRN